MAEGQDTKSFGTAILNTSNEELKKDYLPNNFLKTL